MNSVELRKVQLVQLEILKEIDRICQKHNIKYFLTAGTLIGAIRHKGFIPWDDDLDIGMLRKDYVRFCRIVSSELESQYCFQNWTNTENYAVPFGKIRKKGTVYIESKGCVLEENGIYVDILLYDNAPTTTSDRKKICWKLNTLERMILVKSKAKPWKENDKVIYTKRLGYVIYQLIGLFYSRKKLIYEYEKTIRNVPETTKYLYGQTGEKKLYFFSKDWFKETIDITFEDSSFPIIKGYHGYLTKVYGDYMKLPPKEQRENRHQIIQLKL